VNQVLRVRKGAMDSRGEQGASKQDFKPLPRATTTGRQGLADDTSEYISLSLWARGPALMFAFALASGLRIPGQAQACPTNRYHSG
jgi:hypothetical protein